MVVPLKVLVSTISAPASRYSAWIRADYFRFGDLEQFEAALKILPFPVSETFSAVIRFGEPVSLDHGAHGAVEEDDPLAENGFEGMGWLGHG